MVAYGAVVLIFFGCVFGFIIIAGRITVSISYDIRQTCFEQAAAAAVFVLRSQGGGVVDGAVDQRLLESFPHHGLVYARSGLGNLRVMRIHRAYDVPGMAAGAGGHRHRADNSSSSAGIFRFGC